MRNGFLPLVSLGIAMVVSLPAAAAAPAACPTFRAEPVVMADPALCAELEAKVRNPAALPIGEYETVLNAYGANFCHRNEAAGWVHDKGIRLAGPRVATLRDGEWSSRNFG